VTAQLLVKAAGGDKGGADYHFEILDFLGLEMIPWCLK
jgi:hypothetical protein